MDAGEIQDLQEIVRALTLVDDVRARLPSACAVCAAAMCGHQVLMSVAIGFKDRPVCAACLGRELGHDPESLRTSICAFLARQRCHRIAWAWANSVEQFEIGDQRPACVWPATPDLPNQSSEPAAVRPHAADTAQHRHWDADWDAGEMSCGDLVLALRHRLQGMKAGEVLKLTAHDAAAPEDLPAWCTLTRHVLVGSAHPVYWIRRRDA